MANDCLAQLTGMAGIPTVNARSGPGLHYTVIYQAPVKMGQLPVRDVMLDEEGTHFDGKVYRWLQLEFPNGRVGWVRDDLVTISGDCTAVGYMNLMAPSLAFALSHDAGEPPTLLFRSGRPAAADEQETRGMTGDPCYATLVGITALDFVNVRSGPGLGNQAVFQAAKGTTKCLLLDSAPEEGGGEHRWFRLSFPDGRAGWVRGDLITVQGDCVQEGFGIVAQPTSGNALVEQPVTNTVIERPTPGASTVESGCQGTVISSIPANVRSGANVTHGMVTRVEPGTTLTIEDSQPQDDGGPYTWLKVTHMGASGWLRNDLMRYEGDCEDFGVSVPAADLYPSPMARYTFVRGYQGINGHRGWDLAREGEPILSGPGKGRVVRVHRCTRCTPDKPSWIQHGIPLGDPTAMADPGWGWGFGNHVIIRYHYDDLPATTQQALTGEGVPNGHLFVVYAHLDQMYVSLNQELTQETQIGTCGNTGQSTGPHLHLEVRAGTNPDNMGPWLSLKLLDPAVLFSR